MEGTEKGVIMCSRKYGRRQTVLEFTNERVGRVLDVDYPLHEEI